MVFEENPNQEPDKTITVEGEFTIIEDDLEPPPLDVSSNFDTIAEWLKNMCKEDKPKNKIDRFNFGLFESEDEYTLTLTGVNICNQADCLTISIDFRPIYTYFTLPKCYHENLDRDSLIVNLKSELTDFTKTETFQSSFFTKSESVCFETIGEALWTNQIKND